MGMTMTQKILAARAGVEKVKAGELYEAKLDLVLGNDITAPVAIQEFLKAGFKNVYDKDKVVIVLDHFTPNKDIKAAEQCAAARKFALEQKLKYFFDVGNMGIEHALLPEQGIVAPGDLIIGADSHTCTYGAVGAMSTGVGSTDMAAGMASGIAWFKIPPAIKFNLIGKLKKWVSGKDVILHIIGLIGVEGALYSSMEFTGDGIKNLTMDDRFTICNMAVEAGAKNGIFPVDDILLEYLNGKVTRPYTVFEPDADAEYMAEYTIDLSEIGLTVSAPHIPSNTKTVAEVSGIKIDQVVIGSCTNGRLSDLRMAAKAMNGKKVAPNIRCIVIPATQQIYLDALSEGIIETFVKAGAAVSTPTCGPCLGGHMGVLGKGERAVATTNRNFVGRMGHQNSEIYLAGPSVAGASAVAGHITAPDDI